MITIEATGTEELKVKFQSMGGKLKDALRQGMQIAMFDLQRYVKQEKLSGQVLKVRTGNLRSNINQTVEDQGGQIVGSVGTNVKYGRVHEYGGTVSIPEHDRRLMSGKTVTVRAHTATFPARSFLRSSLSDRRDRIIATLEASAKRVTHA